MWPSFRCTLHIIYSKNLSFRPNPLTLHRNEFHNTEQLVHTQKFKFQIIEWVIVCLLHVESATQTPVVVQHQQHNRVQLNPPTSSSIDILDKAAIDSNINLLTTATKAIPYPKTHSFQSGSSDQSSIGSHIPQHPSNTTSNTVSPQFSDQQQSTSQTIALSPSQMAAATTSPLTSSVMSFAVNELVWGPARGHPAWPGKVVPPPDGVATSSDSAWVQFFGGRPHNIELVTVTALKSLSEGLDAHHRAQKDTRKWAIFPITKNYDDDN